jgi:hypothetical protein
MKKKHLLIFNIVMFCMIIFSNANAQSSISDKESARVFVQKFYDWYVVLYLAPPDKSRPVCSCIAAINQRAEYFHPLLRKALIDDNNAQLKVKGEIVGLDFDPFLSGQDIGRGYQTGNVKQIGNRFLVDIHDIEKGKSNKTILAAEIPVIVELAKVNEHWVFTNFIYLTDGKRYNLLDQLKSLHKDRNKFTR